MEVTAEQTVVIAAAHGAKVRRAVQRYNLAVAGMDPHELPVSYEAANGIFRVLEMQDDRVTRKVEADCILFPRSLKKQMEDGAVRQVHTADRMLKFFVRCKAQRPAAALPGVEWRKTPSGGVEVMQLKKGRRGRLAPSFQQQHG